MSSEHFRLTGEVVPTSGPWHGRIHDHWFPVQQAHLFRENEPGNHEFTCFGTPSSLRDPASPILHSLSCAICSNLLCTCPAPLTPRKHSPYAFIIHAQGEVSHFWGIRLQSSTPDRLWVNVDALRQFAQPMNDAALLQELYRLGESDVAGISVPHQVTILRGPRPSPAQLDGLAKNLCISVKGGASGRASRE